MALGAPIIVLLLAVLGIAVGVFLVVFLIVPIFKGIGWLIKHIFRFVTGMLIDALRLVGSVVTAIVMVPLIIGNVVLGRWSASAHYGRSLQSEIVSAGLSIYRLVIGHPARLLLLSALTEGLEKRLPAAVAAAPITDRPRGGRHQQFDGYTIIGSLQAGGSGGKLYVASPEPAKRAAFDRAGYRDVQQVVIKTFSLEDGSELPQIVRESRALDAARKLGLVLDHELTNSRFHYVMRYVPGQPLGLVTPQLHAASGGTGLDDRHLHAGVSYIIDLLDTLENYHRGGLWHKDVKPDNIIVDGQRAHLVDFGLVTPLRSSMTLTTHGTEYFRDPELVRLALKGVKVSEVDGARFDVYAAGAVLYSIIENSFPAHGVLSQVTRRCPEALKWVIRRAMADYDKRYPSAAAMLLDLRAVAAAPDAFALKPIDLPSMQGQVPDSPRPFDEAAYRPTFVNMPPMNPPPAPFGQPAAAGFRDDRAQPGRAAFAGSPVPPAPHRRPSKPRISIRNWWTGEFSIRHDQGGAAAVASPAAPAAYAAAVAPVAAPIMQPVEMPAAPAGFTPIPNVRRSAVEQLKSARARASARRERATTRMASRRAGRQFSTEPNVGVFMALFVFLGICVLVVGGIVAYSLNSQSRRGGASFSESDWEGGWANMTIPLPPIAPVPPMASEPAIAPPDGAVEMDDAQLAAASFDHGVADGTIFVWVDLQRPLSSAHETAIRHIVGRFEELGFTVVGETPGVVIPAETKDELVTQTAELVAVSSALPWDSDQVRDVISNWAGLYPEFDLVLRFHGQTLGPRSEIDPASALGVSLVTRHSDDPGEAEHLRELFLTAQRSLQRGSF
ncbi:MAG: hypothetical protein AMXMBFR58_10460 [Phycisphaerae bacterium]